jgi:hypothetical protein
MVEILKNSDLFISPTANEESERTHSAELDRLFGFRVKEIEQGLLDAALKLNPSGNVQTLGHSLHKGNQTWIGLDYQTLQTPYSELKQMLSLLKTSPLHVVDLGAGYGRMALVLQQTFPDCHFTGFELVKERVLEGQRIFYNYELPNAKLFQVDLMDEKFRLPLADIYFLYDFGKIHHIRHILNQFKNLADHHTFKLIARGNGSRSLIDHEHPWLSQVYPVIHEKNFSIYSMN